MAKRDNLFNRVGNIEPVTDSEGQVVTATPVSAPEPISPPDPVREKIDQTFDERIGSTLAGTDDLAAQGELLRQQLSPAFRFGDFVPQNLQEVIDIDDPGFSIALREGFGDGLLGWMYGSKPSEQSYTERARRAAEIDNYRERHGFRAFVGEALGGLTSDLPVEFVVALGTAGLGNGILWGARSAQVGKQAFKQMAHAVKRVRQAYGAPVKGRVFKDTVTRWGSMFAEGAVAGAISESVQQSLGKRGDMRDVIERAVLDGVAAGRLHQACR